MKVGDWLEREVTSDPLCCLRGGKGTGSVRQHQTASSSGICDYLTVKRGVAFTLSCDFVFGPETKFWRET